MQLARDKKDNLKLGATVHNTTGRELQSPQHKNWRLENPKPASSCMWRGENTAVNAAAFYKPVAGSRCSIQTGKTKTVNQRHQGTISLYVTHPI